RIPRPVSPDGGGRPVRRGRGPAAPRLPARASGARPGGGAPPRAATIPPPVAIRGGPHRTHHRPRRAPVGPGPSGGPGTRAPRPILGPGGPAGGPRRSAPVRGLPGRG